MRIPRYNLLPRWQFALPSRVLILVVFTALLFPHMAAPQTANRNETVEREFLAWARQNLRPLDSIASDARLAALEPLRRMIGNAAVVSFGEGLHGGAEPLEFRNLLFRFLVERMGFTAIAIENGIIDGYVVNQYALGGPGEFKTVVAKGFTNGFNRPPQNAALVEWMRAYNADPKQARKIQFYGFDVPPSDPKMALEDALRYLDGVAPAEAIALRERTKPMLPKLNLNRRADAPNNYSHLAQPLRDELTAAIADLNTLFKIHESEYRAATSDKAYQLAYRSAVVAAQVDEYLRQVPAGWTPQAGMEAVSGTIAVSDRSKADNAHWMLEQQGAGGKILLFAHRDHLATSLTSIRIPEQNAYGLPPSPLVRIPPMMGIHLQQRYGARLVTIGNLLAEDTSDCRRKRPPASAGSLEALLAQLNTPFFMLDMRAAPRAVAAWLQPSRELYGLELPDSGRHIAGNFTYEIARALRAGAARLAQYRQGIRHYFLLPAGDALAAVRGEMKMTFHEEIA